MDKWLPSNSRKEEQDNKCIHFWYNFKVTLGQKIFNVFLVNHRIQLSGPNLMIIIFKF